MSFIVIDSTLEFRSNGLEVFRTVNRHVNPVDMIPFGKTFITYDICDEDGDWLESFANIKLARNYVRGFNWGGSKR